MSFRRSHRTLDKIIRTGAFILLVSLLSSLLLILLARFTTSGPKPQIDISSLLPGVCAVLQMDSTG